MVKKRTSLCLSTAVAMAFGAGFLVASAAWNPPKGSVIGLWKTPKESNAQVELHLRANRTFESHEFWIGDETKPQPSIFLTGTWSNTRVAIDLNISNRRAEGGVGFDDRIPMPKTKHLSMSSGRIAWDDRLRLERVSKKP